MAPQFFTDFTEYTDDAQPSDWTERWNTNGFSAIVKSSGVPSGGGAKALLVTQTEDPPGALSWDDVGTPSGDVEILTRSYRSAGSLDLWGAVIHGGGSEGSDAGYLSRFIPFINQYDIIKLTSGTGSEVAIDVVSIDGGAHRGVWLFERFRYETSGTLLMSKKWTGVIGDEPGTWTLEGSDSDLSSGWAGVAARFNGTIVYYDFVGIGTGGDPAPHEAPSGATTRRQGLTTLGVS